MGLTLVEEKMAFRYKRYRGASVAVALLLLAGMAQAAEEIKPGWNLFSPAQDVEMGKEAAQEIEKEVQILDDRTLTNYVAGIGKRLAANSQAPDYPYTFKVVAEPSINAFALPGGPIYVHSGLIAAADNEAQLAGVMAHEIAHVALRHSTNRVSKAYAVQIPIMLAAGALDKKGGLLGTLGQLGIGFGVNSLFLKYSRSAEKDADIVGARMMARSGYDPVEMARFFEKLEAEGGSSGRMPQFFSDHPNPGNRVRYVEEEVRQLPSGNYTKGSGQFQSMKERAAKVAPKKTKAQAAPSRSRGAGDSRSGEFRSFRGRAYDISYPGGWQVHTANEGMAVTIIPENGVVRLGNGTPAMARGVMAGYFEPNGRGLARGTNELIEDLRASNPQLNPLRGQRQSTSLGGQAAESVLLQGRSPIENQREFVWLVTTERPQGLFYMVMVAPEGEYGVLRSQYQDVVNSVQFR